jgi:hypothetical protein
MDGPMLHCVAEQRKEAVSNMPPTAKSLWDRLRKEEAKLRERLETMEEEHDLAVELHAPSGTIIRIGMISYFTDTNDALLVQGRDVSSDGEACEAIVPVESFLVIFRITPLEGGEPERKPVGFHVAGSEGFE